MMLFKLLSIRSWHAENSTCKPIITTEATGETAIVYCCLNRMTLVVYRKRNVSRMAAETMYRKVCRSFFQNRFLWISLVLRYIRRTASIMKPSAKT